MKSPRYTTNRLVAIAAQAQLNHSLHVRLDALGASQLANALGRLSDSQVARPCLAMLGFAGGGQSETLFGGFVSL